MISESEVMRLVEAGRWREVLDANGGPLKDAPTYWLIGASAASIRLDNRDLAGVLHSELAARPDRASVSPALQNALVAALEETPASGDARPSPPRSTRKATKKGAADRARERARQNVTRQQERRRSKPVTGCLGAIHDFVGNLISGLFAIALLAGLALLALVVLSSLLDSQ